MQIVHSEKQPKCIYKQIKVPLKSRSDASYMQSFQVNGITSN